MLKPSNPNAWDTWDCLFAASGTVFAFSVIIMLARTLTPHPAPAVDTIQATAPTSIVSGHDNVAFGTQANLGLNAFVTLPPGTEDTATFADYSYANVSIFDPDHRDREVVTVHSQARKPVARAHVKRATNVYYNIVDDSENAHWCATQCKDADECFAVVVVDSVRHVEHELPCVNGKVGTWVVQKLP